MLAKVLSCAVVGLGGELVDVEVNIEKGIPPVITVVGLADMAGPDGPGACHPAGSVSRPRGAPAPAQRGAPGGMHAGRGRMPPRAPDGGERRRLGCPAPRARGRPASAAPAPTCG